MAVDGETGPGRDQQRARERSGPGYAAAQLLDHKPSQGVHLFTKNKQEVNSLQTGN